MMSKNKNSALLPWRLAIGIAVLGLLAGCGTDPASANDDENDEINGQNHQNDQNDQNDGQAVEIDEFTVVPELATVGQDVEFSWSVSGDVERCELDVTGDGDADHEVDACGDESGFTHAYTEVGTYEVTLRVVGEGDEHYDEATASVEVLEGEAPQLESDFEHHQIVQNSIAEPVQISEQFTVSGNDITSTDELIVEASPSDTAIIGSETIDLQCDDSGECEISFFVDRPDEVSVEVLVTAKDEAGFSSGASISVSVQPRWVASPENSGTATFREAVAESEDGDYIGFDFDGAATITLFAPIEIDTDVHIIGSGRDQLTIDGQLEDRILMIDEKAMVDISEMTLRRGASPEGEDGGAIYTEGTLSLYAVTIEDSTANTRGGGAIYSAGFTTIEEGIFDGNDGSFGGAIQSISNFEADETLFINNEATATGGAVYQGGGTLTDDGQFLVTNSAFVGNYAGNHGAGLLNDDDLGKVPMTVINTTFVDNVVESSGAAIFNLGLIDVSFSTIVGNSVEDSDSGNNRGGGIRASGIGSMRMKATIVADNETPGGEEADVSGEIESLGYNFISDSDGFESPDGGDPFADTDVVGAASPVGDLADNGGFTQTVAPDSGSEVVDHIPATDCRAIGAAEQLSGDQRGEERPGGGGDMCDSGAVELQ